MPDSSKTYDLKRVLKILENGNHFLKSKTKQLLPEYAAFEMWLELLFIKHHGHFETFLKLKLPHYSVSQIRYFRNYGRLAKLYPKLKNTLSEYPRNDNAYFQNRNGTHRKPNGSSRLEIVPLNTRTRV